MEWMPSQKRNTNFDLTKLIGGDGVNGEKYTLNDATRYNATSKTYQWKYVFSLVGEVDGQDLSATCPTDAKYAVYQVS